MIFPAMECNDNFIGRCGSLAHLSLEDINGIYNCIPHKMHIHCSFLLKIEDGLLCGSKMNIGQPADQDAI